MGTRVDTEEASRGLSECLKRGANEKCILFQKFE